MAARLQGEAGRDDRPQCSQQVPCAGNPWAEAFKPYVEVQCYRDPALILTDPCLRVRARSFADREFRTTDLYIHIVVHLQPSYVAEQVIYDQDLNSFDTDEPLGVALDGVLIFSGAHLGDLDPRGESGPRVDSCGGSRSSSRSDGLYYYGTLPACVLQDWTEDKHITERHAYVNDVGDLMDRFVGFTGPHLLGLSADGYPIYSPYSERSLVQTKLDSCNGKVVNDSYAYYTTPWVPYTVGCFGPGSYPVDLTEGTEGSRQRGAASACPSGSRYSLHTNGCELCPEGYYSVTSNTISPGCTEKCPVGHYCPAGTERPVPCPRGRFGSSRGEGRPSCSGPCREGYWCPEGSWQPNTIPCGNASYFCPIGSSFPQNVLPSFYSLPEGNDLKHKQMVCEPGYYCIDGIRIPCPAGVYGETNGLITAACTSVCPIGYYCPQGSQIPVPCPAGRFGAEVGLSDSSCSGPCDIGHWCPLASSSSRARQCPGGRYGPVEGLRTSHCSATCEPLAVLSDWGSRELPARLHVGSEYRTSEGLAEDLLPNLACVYNYCMEGYYCPNASFSATQVQCGDPSFYCPTGSEDPTIVSPGHYTIGHYSRKGEMQSESDASTRIWQAPCESGFFCRRGVKRRCAAGRFGADPAEQSRDCSGPCDLGFFCKEGSSNRRQNPCGNPSVFCPSGSSSPHIVPAGYYSVNGTDSTRSAILHCPPGHYCVSGIKRPCAAGRYSAEGSLTMDCDGLCTAGYYCPVASTSETQHSCPAGRYGHAGMTDDSCLGICARGYYCPLNSTSPQQHKCGGEYVYCPVGSAHPLQVAYGHYSSGGTSATRFSQLRCEYDSPVLGTPPAAAERVNICPTTTQWEL